VKLAPDGEKIDKRLRVGSRFKSTICRIGKRGAPLLHLPFFPSTLENAIANYNEPRLRANIVSF